MREPAVRGRESRLDLLSLKALTSFSRDIKQEPCRLSDRAEQAETIENVAPSIVAATVGSVSVSKGFETGGVDP